MAVTIPWEHIKPHFLDKIDILNSFEYVIKSNEIYLYDGAKGPL